MMLSNSVDCAKGEMPMTDYQFKQYEAIRAERDALSKKLDTVYAVIESKVSAGASPEDILSAVNGLKNI